MIKTGVILVGVGMHKGLDGKLHGDYNESDMQQSASFYTPIPGGVGPVNVAMLLKNLVVAAEKWS
jgi:methylenetetrahydrofolate dehydrogenase (NADP+)/methenyltetrahydrofolate cyclohydrolase